VEPGVCEQQAFPSAVPMRRFSVGHGVFSYSVSNQQCQLASVEKNRKLQAANYRRRLRQDRRREYITTGGALQAEYGRALVEGAQRGPTPAR
jgi:hypothetical protein